MIPGKYDITIYRGGTWHIAVAARDENDTPVSLGIYDEIRMQIRPPWVKGMPTKAPLFELSLANGRITVVNDNINLKISAADTGGMAFDAGRYELEMVRHVDLAANPPVPEEIVDKLIYGAVIVMGEVTV